MCGGGGGGSDYADQLREQEAERQFRIDQGMQELERVFAPLYGQRYEEGTIDQMVPGAGGPSASPGGDGPAIFQPIYDGGEPVDFSGLEGWQQDEEGRWLPPGKTFDPDAALSPGVEGQMVDDPDLDPIWDTVRQDYQDFALPQLRRQQGNAAEDLTYALARGGQLTGSVGQDRWIDLGEQFALTRQDVASEADRLARSRQSDVLDTRRNLTNLLQTTADPNAVAQQATDSLTMLSSQPSFNSLGPLFQNATAGLAGGVAGQQQFGLNQQVNQITGSNPYTRDPSRGSGRVVR